MGFSQLLARLREKGDSKKTFSAVLRALAGPFSKM
jgi:hypothetical protein